MNETNERVHRVKMDLYDGCSVELYRVIITSFDDLIHSSPTTLRGGRVFTDKDLTTQGLVHPPELPFSTEPFATGAKTRFVLDGVIPVYWYELPAPRG
jgi:hypothetical protein